MSDELVPGLEGVVVSETRLSDIDGAAGKLVLAGYPLAELAGNATFEETAFLFRTDRLPTRTELDSFRASLAARRSITDETRALLRAAAVDGDDPMNALRMGAAAASVGTAPDESVASRAEEDANRAIAVFPTIVATYWRYRTGREPIAPRDDLSHAANYLYMLTGEEPAEETVRGLETYLNTVAEHGMNASTFTARVIVSTESDVLSAVTGAVGTLKGPLHGGAPGPVLDMLLEVHEGDETPGAFVRRRLADGERVMGLGHRVYEVRDPRATVLAAAAERFYTDGDDGRDRAFFETATETERVAVELLAEHKPGRALETNVEFYTAVLLYGLGVPQELFSATFGVARVAGWAAHCQEQLANNRIVRPRGRYVGETGREWTPLDDRSE